jgi:hypothetical protein
MDKKLQLIRHLYGESDDRSELRHLLEEADVKEEYQALSEIKFLLDHSKRERPDPGILDQIRAVAAQEDVVSSPRGVRKDRAALPRQHSKQRRWLGSVAALTVLFITVSIGYRWYQSPSASEAFLQAPAASETRADASAEFKRNAPAPVAEKEEAGTLDESLQFADRPANKATSEDAMEPADLSAAGLAKTDTTLPAWNDLDDIRWVERRIDVLLDEVDEFNWGQPAVPLEMLPPAGSSATGSGLQQTGSRKPGN